LHVNSDGLVGEQVTHVAPKVLARVIAIASNGGIGRAAPEPTEEDVTVTTNELIGELNALIRLTESEAAIARSRIAQARDDRTRQELESNANEAGRRRDRLVEAVRSLGGAPDLLGGAVGRIGTFARTQTLDQAMTVTQGLMADLMLEHQLRDRAQFARVLAETLEETPVVQLLTRIEEAHTETIEWIQTRLAEVAVGGPAAIRPTPLQAVAGVGQRVAMLPSRAVMTGVNRAVLVAAGVQGAVAERLGRTRDLAEAAGEGVTAGRNEFLRTSEDQARDQGARRTAQALHRVRAESGALSEEELPIRSYDGLSVAQAKQRITRLGDAAEVRAVLAYEAANKNRKGVVEVAEQRIEHLAEAAAD
jgi:bacterioferritin (cytochrome b1)